MPALARVPQQPAPQQRDLGEAEHPGLDLQAAPAAVPGRVCPLVARLPHLRQRLPRAHRQHRGQGAAAAQFAGEVHPPREREGQCYFVPGYKLEHAFKRGAVYHLLEPDVHQEIYGLPEYLSALQSALLNESSTLSGASATSTAAMPATSCTSAIPPRTRTPSTPSGRRCGTRRGRETSVTCSCTAPTARRTGCR